MNKDEKALELLKAIGDIKDEYVEEASLDESASDSSDNVVDFTKSTKKSYTSKKWAGLAVAACLVLVVGFGVWKVSDIGTKDTASEMAETDNESEDIAHYDMADDVESNAEGFAGADSVAEEAESDDQAFKSFEKSRSANTLGLTDGIKESVEKDAVMSEEAAKNLTASSMKIFSEVVKNEEPGKNILISPTSILYAFGMLENGAKGDTLKELEEAVNNGATKDDLNAALHALKNRLYADASAKWNVANSLWIRDNDKVSVNKDFLSSVKQYYGADVFKAPFDSTTLNDINSWVNENTDQMIPAILQDIDSESVMYLINAMCFKGEWLTQYEEAQIEKDAEFVGEDGAISNVNILRSDEDNYFTLGDGYGFVKEYRDSEYAFVGIEVSDEISLDDYIMNICKDPEAFRHAVDYNNLNYESNVIVRMPEFTYDYDKEFAPILQGMGVNDAFDMNKADFTGIFDDSKPGDYSVGSVIHKTHIEVDRYGTKAAAATAIAMVGNAMPSEEREIIEINLDHPFVYAIIDRQTNIPIFIGCVKNL